MVLHATIRVEDRASDKVWEGLFGTPIINGVKSPPFASKLVILLKQLLSLRLEGLSFISLHSQQQQTASTSSASSN